MALCIIARNFGARLCALALASALTADLRAEETPCPAIAGGNATLAQASPSRRLLFIQRELNVDARNVRVWAWAWSSIYTGLIIGNAARLGTSKAHGDIVDSAFATGASSFGLAVLAVMPPAVLRDQPRLARLVSRYDATRDSCAVVAGAERILLRDAASEAFGRGPLVHAGNFAFNALLGIVMGVAFHRWETAAIVAPVGTAVGELQQATIVTHIDDTLARYRRGELGERPSSAPVGWTLIPRVGKDELGAAVGLAF